MTRRDRNAAPKSNYSNAADRRPDSETLAGEYSDSSRHHDHMRLLWATKKNKWDQEQIRLALIKEKSCKMICNNMTESPVEQKIIKQINLAWAEDIRAWKVVISSLHDFTSTTMWELGAGI